MTKFGFSDAAAAAGVRFLLRQGDLDGGDSFQQELDGAISVTI